MSRVRQEKSLIANAPARGELASAWIARQVEFMRQRAPSRTTAEALAYIHGMQHTLSMLEYYEDFSRRRDKGEVDAYPEGV